MSIKDPGRGGGVSSLLGSVTRKEANVDVRFGVSMVSENSVSSAFFQYFVATLALNSGMSLWGSCC